MKKTRASASLALAILALSGCAATRAPILVAGGSGIEGSGLDDRRPRSPLEQLLAAPAPQIGVLELSGEAQAGRPLKPGDRFATDAVFELRQGTARLRLPGEMVYTITGPARVQFARVDGLLAPLVDLGQVDSATAGRVATPGIAALICETGFRMTRSAGTATFDCGRGTLRWAGTEGAVALADAKGWVLDEAQRSASRR